jgi:Ca2+-binding EF-hand superfamily protein
MLLIGALTLLLGPATALTQMGQPGGGPRGGFPGGGGFNRGGGGGGNWRGQMNMDPNERWNQMTGGKDVWVRSEITDQRQQFFFDMIARQAGVTNGQITRQQYLEFTNQMRARFQNGGFGRPGGGGPGGPGAGGGRPPQGGGFDPNAFAEVLFKRYDKNGDGLLNNDEMPENLKAEKEKWDKNGDGFIDLNEFKEFIKARGEQMRQENGWPSGGPGGANGGGGLIPISPETPVPVEDEPKRVVYRAGKLPKELPAWFAQYDKDGDGQIGLYEWKLTGRSLDEFFKMDRNGDGFLTVEEVLRYEAEQKKGSGGRTAGGPGSATFSPPGGGGPPGPGNGGPPANFGNSGQGGGPRQIGPGNRGGNGNGGRGRRAQNNN